MVRCAACEAQFILGTLLWMLGHTKVLQQLHECFAGVDDHGVACVVSGSPGVGKTFVANNFLDLLPTSVTCLRGRGLRTGVPPLHPICEPLRNLEAGKVADQFMAMFEELSQSIPVSKQFVAPLVRARNDTQLTQARMRGALPSETQIFFALAHVLSHLEGDEPLVVFIDNIQWIDPSTLKFLGYLATELAQRRVFLLVSWRTNGTLHENARSLRDTLNDEANPLVHEFCIDGLSRSEQPRFLQITLGGPIEFDATQLEWLANSSQSNPSYLRELARLLRDRGEIAQVGGVWRFLMEPKALRIPPSHKGLLIERRNLVAEAMPEALDLLDIAACVGSTAFDIRLIAGALELPHARDIARMLERVEASSGLVVRVDTTTFEFSHELTREFFVQDLADAAPELHAKLAHAMMRRGNEELHVVAQQFEAAGEPAIAASMYLEAAHIAHDRSLFTSSIDYGQHAERLLDEAGFSRSADERIEVVHTVASAMHRAEQYTQTINYIEARLDHFDGLPAARLRHLLGRTQARVPDAEINARGLQHCNAVLTQLEGTGRESMQLEVLTDLVNLHDATRGFAASREAYDRALALARRIDHRVGLVRLARISCIFLSPGEVVERIEPAIADAAQLGLWFEQAMCENNLGTARLNLREFNRATAHYQQAADILRAHGGHRIDTPLNNLGVVAYHMNDWERARELLGQALTSSCDPHSKWFIESNLAALEAQIGELEVSFSRLNRIASEAKHSRDLFYRDCIGHNLANVLLELRRPDEALQRITDTPLHTSHGEDELVRGKRAELVLRIFAALDQPAPREHVEAYEQLAASALPQAWLYRSPWYVSDIEFWED